MQLRRINNVFMNSLRISTFYVRKRLMNSNNVKSLLYKEYGDPVNVLQIKTESLEHPKENEVLVKWLFAPINPADINTIQGKYPSKPSLPAVPGNEGVGEILAVGPSTPDLSVGDKVIPNGVHKGTWRSHALYKSEELFKIYEKMNAVDASMLNVNPCTAYRMLKDFVHLKPDDTIIQNGANSSVGQLVIQLCKIWGIRSINIVRSRPDIENLKEELLELGATTVLTEEELRTTKIFKEKILQQPQLALNCVCGKSALELQRHLGHGAIMVTYGGMSREPLSIPAGSLIFKDISFKGFWMTAWNSKNSNSVERQVMYDELQNWFIEGKLQTPPYQLVPFHQYEKAVENTLPTSGRKSVKYVLDLQKNS